jgi:hypothetical protein
VVVGGQDLHPEVIDLIARSFLQTHIGCLLHVQHWNMNEVFALEKLRAKWGDLL